MSAEDLRFAWRVIPWPPRAFLNRQHWAISKELFQGLETREARLRASPGPVTLFWPG